MTLQPHEIYEYERARWMAAARKHKSFVDWLSWALPFLLIVVQVATFWVSATHTADMINLIAPERGVWGVVAFELGLIIFSLLVYRTKHSGGIIEKLWIGIEVAMTFMIILSNVAGSLSAVVRASNIKDLSFAAIMNAFGTLPLTTQLGLIVGFIFAVGIPALFIGTGQAFANLILNQASDGNDPMEARWLSNGYPFVYRAFFAQFSNQGMKPSDAKLLAKQMAAGFFGQAPRSTALPEPPTAVFQALPDPSKSVPVEIPKGSHEPSKRVSNAFQAALDAYANGLSKKDVIDQRIAGKSTAYAAWSQHLKDVSRNGHGKPEDE